MAIAKVIFSPNTARDTSRRNPLFAPFSLATELYSVDAPVDGKEHDYRAKVPLQLRSYPETPMRMYIFLNCHGASTELCKNDASHCSTSTNG